MNLAVKSSPKITVLMPVYNCELYVGEAIDSILNQTYTDFELLIIDDASKDATASIVKSYNDSRIQLIEKPINTGYTNSLNHGLKIARGEYIARMDGDDICMPERFFKQVSYLESHPETVLCATAFKVIGREVYFSSPEEHDAIKLAFLEGNCICHSSIMMRKATLDAHDILYDKTKEPAEDYAMWIQLLFLGKLYILPEILVEYRVYANQVSAKRAEEQMKIDIQLKFELLNHLDITITPEEYQFLEKYYRNTQCVDYNELVIFKKLQKKLSQSNAAGFFEPKAFQRYLSQLEVNVMNRYFNNYFRYSPILYVKYLMSKWNWKTQIHRNEEVKLFVKCLIFKKVA
ncbi:glycosyltransferase family 2 protein [Flavobacterium faecale]|uniref:glycosyltransferase family 2 protein n=1 Tax=Flavobacterium faecale TaxID=1355330 RepID=UPI003AB0D626